MKKINLILLAIIIASAILAGMPAQPTSAQSGCITSTTISNWTISPTTNTSFSFSNSFGGEHAIPGNYLGWTYSIVGSGDMQFWNANQWGDIDNPYQDALGISGSATGTITISTTNMAVVVYNTFTSITLCPPTTATPTNAPATNTPTSTNSPAPGTATPTGGPTLTPTRVGIPSTGDTWYWTHHEMGARVDKDGSAPQSNQTVNAYSLWGGAGDAVFVAVNHKGHSSTGLWVKAAAESDPGSGNWITMKEMNGQSWNDYTSFVTDNVAINFDEVVRQAGLMGYSRIDHFLSRVPEYGANFQAQYSVGAEGPPFGPITSGYAEITSIDVLHYNNQSNTECKPWGELKTFDLTKVGNLVGGSYTSFPTPDGNIQIDASITYELPAAVYGQYGFTTAGLVWDITPNAQSNLPSPATLIVNGAVYTGDNLVSSGVLPGVTVAIAPGTKTINLHFSQHLPEYLAPSVLNKLLLTVTLQSPFGQGLLNCDGDMELLKEYTPWMSLQPEKQVGRLTGEGLPEITEGAPACGYGWHVVGNHPAVGINRKEAGTAYEYFTVPYSGMMYYKFRYRSAGLLGFFASSPNVYIAPKGTGISTDLFGLPGLFDKQYAKSDWTLVRGAVEMEAGNYGLYLDSTNKDWPVYYDDVYFSTLPFGEECTNEKIQDLPATPGPTTTEDISTPIPSTDTVTPDPTNIILTQTIHPSGTPRNTVTPRPSAVGTIRPSATNAGQPNPTQNTTPPGEGTPSGPPNPDMPPTGPGDTIGFIGDQQSDCIRPSNWFSIGWWIDYSRCSITSFIAFGPKQQATAAAIPGEFMKYEPFGTAKEFSDGVVQVRTEVASYDWNGGSAASGVHDAINPTEPLKGGNGFCSDPWNGNLNLGNCSSNIINNDLFEQGCSAKISNYLPGALAKGMCMVFGVTKNIGILPWMQFFINLMALLMPIRTAFTIIGMRNAVSSMVEGVADIQDRSAKNA